MQGLRPPRTQNGPANRSTTPPDYMKLFSASSAALKSVSPKLRVGGPATMQLFDVEDFLARCEEADISVDFVTTHLSAKKSDNPRSALVESCVFMFNPTVARNRYPTCPECQTNDTRARPDCFAELVLESSRIAKRHNLPFFLTE